MISMLLRHPDQALTHIHLLVPCISSLATPLRGGTRLSHTAKRAPIFGGSEKLMVRVLWPTPGSSCFLEAMTAEAWGVLEPRFL